jgi:hypothetical protein
VQREDAELIKRRQIRFCPLHPEPNQAQCAAALLNGAAGIDEAVDTDRCCLDVTYDLRLVTLQTIEEVLLELGFHLDNSLLCKLRRAFFHYTEETQRVNLGHTQEIKSTRDVFVSRYHKLPHGCRDKRPAHWREYL